MDVEADEVDFGRDVDEDADTSETAKCVRWQQWAGIAQRRYPSTLVLFRTRSKLTSRRAPGPGPITKSDWRPAAKKWLAGRKVLLNSDGARSYLLGVNRKSKMPGLIHLSVVHTVKKIGGKWVRPKYVKLMKSKLPEGGHLLTKAGTQIIDRCWQHIRGGVRHISPHMGEGLFASRVRSAQWTYWHRGDDLWTETGLMLKRLMCSRDTGRVNAESTV